MLHPEARAQWQARLQRLDPHPAIDPVLLQELVLPLLTWLEQRCAEGQRRIVIALTAPVGSGKSTLANQLVPLAGLLPLRLAVASIDDAYRPWPERRRHLQGNPFGVNRVPPGSHDPALLGEAIAAWRQGGKLRLPRFDKSLLQGHGDRASAVTVDADALLLEGWLVGYEPVSDARLAAWLASAASDLRHDGGIELSASERRWLPRWNRALAAYQPLWACCDGFWVLQPLHWQQVIRWRLQAEARQRRHGQGAMTACEVRKLVRASLASLPASLYHCDLLGRAEAVATLDGRRRCLKVESGAQASLSSSSMG